MKNVTAVSLSSCVFLAAVLAVSLLDARTVIKKVVDDRTATSPAINDLGEIVYIGGDNRTIFSTTRGVVIDNISFDTIGISNDGEVVYNRNGQIHSTIRGLLATGGSAAISSTSGEVSFTTGSAIETTLQGVVASETLGLNFGVSDVNDLGEVVYEYRDLSVPFTQLVSTARGFVSPANENAIQPSVNNLGEIVWSGLDSFGRQQIFSNVRGQLTSFGGKLSFSTADLPDIANDGTIVFRGRLESSPTRAALYIIQDIPVPEPSGLMLCCFLGFASLLVRARCRVWRVRELDNI